MTRIPIAAALSLALVAASATAAAQASTVHYRVTVASGFERVSFNGTPRAGCAAKGTCGTSGTVTYAFGGKPSRSHASLSVAGGKVTGGSAVFETGGSTKADVTGTPDTAPCMHAVARRGDGFVLKRASRGRLAFTIHKGRPDYLANDCPGPLERDLAKDHALPAALFDASGFSHATLNFGLKGMSPFEQGGYEGTDTWQLKYRLQSGGQSGRRGQGSSG